VLVISVCFSVGGGFTEQGGDPTMPDIAETQLTIEDGGGGVR